MSRTTEEELTGTAGEDEITSNEIFDFSVDVDTVDIENDFTKESYGGQEENDTNGNTENSNSNPSKQVSDELIIKQIEGVFNLISAIRNKAYWKLTDTESETLKSTVGSVKEKFNIMKYLQNFSLISFGITLINAGVTRMIRDFKESKNDDLEEDKENETLFVVDKNINVNEGSEKLEDKIVGKF